MLRFNFVIYRCEECHLVFIKDDIVTMGIDKNTPYCWECLHNLLLKGSPLPLALKNWEWLIV